MPYSRALVRNLFVCLTALGLTAAAPAKPFSPNPPPVSELLKACQDKDGWADPAPPARIDGNVYYVGTCGITVLLIASPRGHVLIDSSVAEAAPQILANIRRLGLDPKDVKWILASHAHFDHTGGLAILKQETGARVAALPDQAKELEAGKLMPEDPQFALGHSFAPVKVDRVLRDGAALKVGSNRVTGFATPGHTKGSTSWIIRACGYKNCPAIAYLDSATAVSAPGFRFVDHPEHVAMFRRGVGRMKTLPCNLVVTPHPGMSALFERFAGEAPLADKEHCMRYAEVSLEKLNERLAQERTAK